MIYIDYQKIIAIISTFMRQRKLLLILLATLALGLLEVNLIARAQNADVESKSTDGIAALVNGRIVTRQSVQRHQRINNLTKEESLKILIDEELIFYAARKAGMNVTDESVEKELQNRIRTLGSPATFKKKVLDQMGLNLAGYRVELKKTMTREKFVFTKIGRPNLNDPATQDGLFIDVFVSPREIKQYFKEHQTELTRENKIKTRQIILRFNDDPTRRQKKELAEGIIEELKKKDGFAELAKQYSEIKANSGGDWGWTERGSFAPDMEKVIYQLSTGQVSPLIETQNSFVIVKVEDKESQVKNFDDPEIQTGIEKKIRNLKINDGLFRLYEKLRDTADIRYTES